MKQWWKPQVQVAYMKAFIAFHALHYSGVGKKALLWKCTNYSTLVCLKVIFTRGCKWNITAGKKKDRHNLGRLTGSYVLCEVVLNWNLCSLRIKRLKSKGWSCCNLSPEIPWHKGAKWTKPIWPIPCSVKNNFPLESFTLLTFQGCYHL